MLVNFIKFIHLLFALGLFSLAVRSVTLIGPEKLSVRLDKLMLWMGLLVLLTGTLLVYPKHFTFHTPWIIAAYALVFIFVMGIKLALFLKKKKTTYTWLLNLIYLFLITLLVFVVHDAVTKTTFLAI